jgi:phosphoribosyl-ATP pyrophosphohydrolase/phosphoribosyl-AMP cyclohydrolase
MTPDFDRAELIPAIVQDAGDLSVLMLGYMNREAWERTLADGEVWFWSRSRGRLWRKGETSGNVLRVRSVRLDCDQDAVLVLAEPAGPTCHTGRPSCFFETVETSHDGPVVGETQEELFATIQQRLRDRPEGSYIGKLAADGVDRIAKKVGEEATEVVIAAKNRDPEELTREMADLWFHGLITLADAGLTPADVWAELAKRRR